MQLNYFTLIKMRLLLTKLKTTDPSNAEKLEIKLKFLCLSPSAEEQRRLCVVLVQE